MTAGTGLIKALYINSNQVAVREMGTEESGQVKQHNMDKDRKKPGVPKRLVKRTYRTFTRSSGIVLGSS